MWGILGNLATSVLGHFGFGGSNENAPDPTPQPKLWENPLFIVVIIFGFITLVSLVFRK